MRVVSSLRSFHPACLPVVQGPSSIFAYGSRMLPLERHRSRVRALVVDPTGTTLASGDEDGYLRLWPLTTRGGDPASFLKVGGLLTGTTTNSTDTADYSARALPCPRHHQAGRVHASRRAMRYHTTRITGATVYVCVCPPAARPAPPPRWIQIQAHSGPVLSISHGQGTAYHAHSPTSSQCHSLGGPFPLLCCKPVPTLPNRSTAT